MRTRVSWTRRGRHARVLAVATSAAAVLLLPLPRNAQAQGLSEFDSAGASPRQAVIAAYHAVAEKNWNMVAALSHPEFLQQFRSQLLAFAAAEEHVSPKQKKPDYGLPKCVEDYFEAQNSHARESFLASFPGVSTFGQLRRLSPQALFASWLAGVHRNELVGPRAGAAPPLILLGQVADGDSVVDVIFRQAGSSDPEAALVAVKRSPEGWRIYPGTDFTFPGAVNVIGAIPNK